MDRRKADNAAAADKGTARRARAEAVRAAESAQAAAPDIVRGARRISAALLRDSAARRTELAGDRTILAAERTYAAWVRTGIVGLAGGIGARELLQGLVPDWMALGQASVLILFAIFCFVAGVWRHLFRVKPQAPDVTRLPGWILTAVNLFLSLVAVAALYGLWVEGPV